MQHDSARSLKLHVLFTVRRSLKVSEPCPSPSLKQPPARIQIQDVRPQVDCGRYPVKSTQGDPVAIAANIFKDGHDILRAVVRYRHEDIRRWLERPLEPVGNDHWQGQFDASVLGRWQFTIEAWVDRYATLLDELDRKLAAGQTDLTGELSEAEALFGPGTVDDWHAAAPKLGAKDRHSKASLPRPRGRRRAGSAPASERGTSSSRAAGAGSRASRECCRSSPRSGST